MRESGVVSGVWTKLFWFVLSFQKRCDRRLGDMEGKDTYI